MRKRQMILSGALLTMVSLYACKKEVVIEQPVATTTTETISTPTETSEIADAAPAMTEQQQKDFPKKANQFLQTYYKDAPVAKYEVKTTPRLGKKYEVKLTSGVEVEFNDAGDWTEIKDPKGVPADLIPASIKSYADTNYKGIGIKKIEKETSKISVELMSGIDLEFDTQGKFLRID